MKVTKSVETVYCDICRTTKQVSTFNFEYFGKGGDLYYQEAHLCPNCQRRVLQMISLESGQAFQVKGL